MKNSYGKKLSVGFIVLVIGGASVFTSYVTTTFASLLPSDVVDVWIKDVKILRTCEIKLLYEDILRFYWFLFIKSK